MDVTQIYNNFAAQYEAMGRVADPTLAGELPESEWYQCVSLIKKYLALYGVQAGLWGSATQYWTTPRIPANIFQRIQTNEVQLGDIVILNFDHIGISNGVLTPTTYQQLDQNGGKGTGTGVGVDAIQIHTFERSQVLGVYRPIVTVPPPPPAAIVSPYTIESITPKQVKTNKQPTNEYGMHYDNVTAMAANVVTSVDAGTLLTAVAICHHQVGYDYYLQDASVANGWNTLDCDDYTPPPPPYVPPAGPITATPAEQYTTVTTLPSYANSTDAQANSNSTGSLVTGTYYVFSKDGIAYDLSTDNMKDQVRWINTLDNVVKSPPAPTPATPIDWKTTYTPSADGKSRTYTSQRDMHILDYNNLDATGINITANERVPIFGSFKKGALTYLMPRLSTDPTQQHWYGIPTTDVYTGLPNMKSDAYQNSLLQLANENRTYRKSVGHSTADDKLYYFEQMIARAVSDGVRFVDGIIPISKLKAYFKDKEKK